MDILIFIIYILVGYALGSINSAIIVGKIFGIDVRTKGSGNAGLTNAHRVLGNKAALFVLVGDILKGVVVILLAPIFKGFAVYSPLLDYFTVAAGAAAVLGHNWPVYFKFKGGKGVLTTLTVILMLDYRVALVALGIFIVVVAVFRYVALGSIMAAVSVPVSALAFGHDYIFILFMIFLAGLIIFRHRANIVRIVHGNEFKFNFKKKETKNE